MDISIQAISLIATCNSNGELLLLKRPDHVYLGGLWSLPGGKVEAGETPLDAAVRELAEETGFVQKIRVMCRRLGSGLEC